MAAIIGEHEGATDLTNFSGTQNHTGNFALQLKQFLDSRYHADEIRREHALQHPCQAEGNQKRLLRC